MKPLPIRLLLLTAVVLSSSMIGCQKHIPGKTESSGVGSPYTVLLATTRNYHHITHTSGPSVFRTDTAADTSMNIRYINDAEVILGGDLLFFAKTSSSDTMLFFRVIDNSFTTSHQLTFSRLSDRVGISNFNQLDSGGSFFEEYTSF